MSTKRSILRTIRIADDVDQILEKEAKERSVSVNTLVSGILARYAEWDRFAEKTRRVSVAHSQLKALFEGASPDTIGKVSFEMAERLIDMGQFIIGSSDINSILRFLEMAGRYSGLWSMEERLKGESILLQFFHHMGREFSEFLAKAVESALKRSGSPHLEVEWDDHVVTLKMAFTEYRAARPDRTDLFSQPKLKERESRKDPFQ